MGAPFWSAAPAARARAPAAQFLEHPPRVRHPPGPLTGGIAAFGLLTILALLPFNDVNALLSERLQSPRGRSRRVLMQEVQSCLQLHLVQVPYTSQAHVRKSAGERLCLASLTPGSQDLLGLPRKPLEALKPSKIVMKF